MTKLLLFMAFLLACAVLGFSVWMITSEIARAQRLTPEETPTFFFRNYLPDAIGIEYFKRAVKEDEVVTCYWITDSKDEVLFHTCKQRSLYD